MLTIPHCKESLSRAYLTAVVGRSRNNLSLNSEEYDYGVDGTVRKITCRTGAPNRYHQSGFGFDFQSKSTTKWQKDKNEIVYDLEASAYNDLVARSKEQRGIPLFLVLLCLEDDDTKWLTIDENQLILRRCAYWFQINGDFTSNTTSKRIRIPDKNLLDPQSINTLLNAIESGALLP